MSNGRAGGYVHKPLQRDKLADDVLLSPHKDYHSNLAIDSTGNAVVTNAESEQSLPVFPHFNLDNHLILSNSTDRGSTGGTVLSLMIVQGYLWTVFWG